MRDSKASAAYIELAVILGGVALGAVMMTGAAARRGGRFSPEAAPRAAARGR